MRRVGHLYGEGVGHFSSAMDRVWHRVLATGSSTALLGIRLAFGLIFMAHGAQKLFGWFGGPGLSATGENFAQMGLQPGIVFAGLVGAVEFFGGLLLMMGLATRLATLGLSVIMVVAMFAVHWKNGFFAQQGGIEYTLALLAGLLAAFVYGGGGGSLDRTIWKRYQRSRLAR